VAEVGASINLQIKGQSKLDRLIGSASQLDSIVKGLNKNPIELSTQKATNALDKFDAELKALQTSIGNSEKKIDSAGNAINEYATQIASLQTKLNQLNPNTVAYNKVLDRQQKAIRGLAQAQSDLSKAQKDLGSSQDKLAGAEKSVSTARTAKLAAEALNGLADSYIKIKTSQKGVELGAAKRPLLESSISQINSQAEALKLVAANAKIASSEFNRFSIASQAASQELFAARQKQLSAIAFGLSKSAPSVNLGSGGNNAALATRNQVQDLVNIYPQIVKSEAALSAYGDELRRVQSLVPYASAEFEKLENVIAELNEEISQIDPRRQKSLITLPQAIGPVSSVEGTLKQRQQYAEAVNKQYQKQLDLSDKIDRAAISVSDKEALSLQLNQALDALGENRLEDAQKMTIEINRQVSAMSRLQKTGSTQIVGALGTGFSPVAGRMPSGEIIPGSPADKGRQVKAKLSWQSALAQMSVVASELENTAKAKGAKIQMDWNLAFEKAKDIISDATLAGLQEGTKAAVALGQQQIREMERSTAKMWREFGGPALPPSRAGGTYRTGEFSPMGGARRLTSTLASGAIVEQSLLNLQSKGVNVADRLVQLQNALNTAKQDTFEISIKSLDALSDEVSLAGKYAQLQRQILAGQGTGGKRGAGKESGFRPALTSAEVKAEINKIVTDFNAVAPKAGSAGENVASTFASNLKSGIQDVIAASTALAGASIDAIRSKLKMRSPSRVMIEIARNLVDTYVNVLEAAIPEIQQASQKAFALPTDLDVVNTTSFPLPKNENITSAIAQSVASFVDPMQSRGFGEFQAFDLIMQKGRRLEPRNVPGIDYSAAEDAAAKGSYGDPEFEKVRQAYVEFYNIPSEFAPDIKRASNAASQASEDAKRLEAEVAGLVSGLEQVSGLFRGAADLVRTSGLPAQQKTATDLVGDYWSNAAIDAKELDDRLKREFTGSGTTKAAALVDFWDTTFDEAQKIARQADEAAAEAAKLRQQTSAPFQASAQKASEIDDQRRRQATFDAFAVARQQAEADARAASEAIASQIIEPVKKSAPEGERRIQVALGNLFDRVSQAFGGLGGFGGFGGGRGRGSGGGAAGGGGPENVDDLQRALDLGDLAPIARATNEQLEELANRLQTVRNQADGTSDEFARLGKQLGTLDREQERRVPDADFLTRRFGPRGGRAVSEGLIGGAFPLLFGQGLGAAVGGGLGGAAGGFAGGGLGFGLSLVGTALGTAFDTAVQSATELGNALNDSAQTFDKVKERALFSSKETEKFADRMQEMGLVASASIVAQQEVIRKVGVGGVNSLKELGDSSDRLNRAWAEFNLQLQAALAGPMAGLLNWVAGIVEESNKRGRREAETRDVFSSLSSEDQKAFNAEVSKRLSNVSNLPQGAAVEQIAQVRKQVAEEFAKKANIAVGTKVEAIDVNKEKIAELTKQLELIDIGKPITDQYRQAAREQKDLDKQRADLVRSYEESLGDIRKRVEDEIRNKRFATLEKENQLLDLQGQIRLRQLQIANQADIARAGVGLRPEAEQAAKEVAQLVATYSEQQLSAEEEAAKIKRNAALEVQKIDFEAANFKAQIEKEVSKLNIETARRVAEINEQVRRRNEEFDKNRFSLEKQLVLLQLKNNEILAKQDIESAEQRVEAAKKAGDTQGAAYAQSLLDIYNSQLNLIEKGREEVNKISAPPALRGVGAVGGGAVATAGLDQATANYKTAVDNYVAAQLKLNELDVVKNAQDFALGIQNLANKTDALLTGVRTRDAEANVERLRYTELINAGLTDTIAQKVIELEATKRTTAAIYDAAIAQLKNKIVAGQVSEEVFKQNKQYRDQIKILKQRKDAQEGRFGEFNVFTGESTGAIGAAIESENGRKIQEFVTQAQNELNDLESVAIRVSRGIGDAVGNSISSGISGLIEGTTTGKEVFANFLKEVSQVLMQQATGMIATYVAIGIAKMFAFGGSGNMGGKNYFDPKTGLGVAGPNFGLADGGIFDASGMQPFANGGMFTNSIVSSPTLFQFADGGAMRTGLMGEAGPEAIMPLRRGPDGRLGVEASVFDAPRNAMQASEAFASSSSSAAQAMTMSEASTSSGSSIGGPITIQTQVINNVEYATVDQVKEASEISVKRARSQVFADLKNRPASRQSAGIK
jgi:hypothetical protein